MEMIIRAQRLSRSRSSLMRFLISEAILARQVKEYFLAEGTLTRGRVKKAPHRYDQSGLERKGWSRD